MLIDSGCCGRDLLLKDAWRLRRAPDLSENRLIENFSPGLMRQKPRGTMRIAGQLRLLRNAERMRDNA